MPVFQQGQVNLTSLIVPDVYVEIIPPSIATLNGVPSNVVGGVGTATWGPVNSPQPFGDMAGYAQLYGGIMPRQFDLGTFFALCVLQGSTSFMGVRVTDGTDTAATASVGTTNQGVSAAAVSAGGASYMVGDVLTVAGGTHTTAATLTVASVTSGAVTGVTVSNPGAYTVLPSNPVSVTGGTGTGATFVLSYVNDGDMTYSAKYTGSLGNQVTVTHAAGSKPGTVRVTVSLPGFLPELFDNLAYGLTGNAVWVAIASAINAGIPNVRSASNIITAAAGTGVDAFADVSYTLAGGTDGASGVVTATMIGTDTSVPRTGMYALRGTTTSIAALVDLADSTVWTNQLAFGNSEGIYMQGTGPAGDSVTAGVARLNTAGVDGYNFKAILGDYPTFNDTVNGVQRLVSPQGFVAGVLGALSPEQSSLNKEMNGIITTQRLQTGQPYSAAELGVLFTGRTDVITSPCPGGAYFGARLGINSSSNANQNGDNYTRLTNYIAWTLEQGMGYAVGKPQTVQLQRGTKATISNFLQNMQDNEMIQAFSVTLDSTNNSAASMAAGYMVARVKVTYLNIVRYFIIELEGGQNVTVTQSNV